MKNLLDNTKLKLDRERVQTREGTRRIIRYSSPVPTHIQMSSLKDL